MPFNSVTRLETNFWRRLLDKEQWPLTNSNNALLKSDDEIGSNLLCVARCPPKHVEEGEGGTLAHPCKSKGSTAKQRGD
ncbi:hypothetical protein C1H46_022343 [Malus baccata]|uniref:Uncharacterized protein n=1 Tax=Malus baccata TaxID=106549 RepID=A0A540LZZ7_MALBA|nr:hypothetical protein C1H46_022343 [Malus baccata]